MLVRSLLLASLLVSAGLVQANDDVHQNNTVNHQQLSKRPYAAPVDRSEKFEGNTANENLVEQDKKYKTLNLHMLGKRPWSEKTAD